MHRANDHRPRPLHSRRTAVAVLAALGLALVAGACGDDGRTAVGDRYVWRELRIDRDAAPTSLALVPVMPSPPAFGERPAVLVGSGEAWTLQRIDDELGFVTDVITADRRVIAVGAVGEHDVPPTLDKTVALRPAMWIGDEQARWTRVALPSPANGPGWFVGIEKGNGVVAVGRTAGPEGDVFALRSDLAAERWTASIVASGPGLQLAGTVVGAPDRTVVAGRGTTWTSRDGGDWVQAVDPNRDDADLATVGVAALGGHVYLAAGPGRNAASGDAVVTRSSGPTVRLDNARVLAGGALENDLVLVTEPVGSALAGADRPARLGLVTVPLEGATERAELPVRAIDVTAVSMWQPGIPGEATFVAVRREDGTLLLAGLARKDA